MIDKKTKIIASVGPVTKDENSLISLYQNGVNVIRFNFSHADYDSVKDIISKIKNLNIQGITNLSLLLDTKGPEIRTGDLEQKIDFKKGNIFNIFYKDSNLCTNNDLYCDYEYLGDLNIGDIIRIDSGLFDVEVVSKGKDFLEVKSLNSAKIGSRRHINLPGIKIKLPGITDKDKKDILFGIENGVDFIALSFVRNKSNIDELKTFLKENNAEHIKIISKIENQEAIENLDSIIENSDGVMVARGDLGIEVDIEKLPNYQKTIVQKCRDKGIFVIVATHLLETMIDSPFPTRAEVSDIYNAVLQKADALMLSGETTIGTYPIESVNMMSKVIKSAEDNINYEHNCFENIGLNKRDVEKKKLIKHGFYIGEDLGVKAIIILTKTGKLARIAATYKPNNKVFAFTKNENTLNYINILFGIEGIKMNFDSSNTENVDMAIKLLYEKGKITKADKLIAIADNISKNGKEIPIMQIINVDDIIL
ncbi:pyruvate kinase [Candidatus Vampirococcus lugosii]|uniref:Pyruvate kinase n=1 Tax=Candidatus Vampirococcus lugosii TaxID=2789015 RepID=A0ABS5QMF6_9BACT|nr:pyruvate kinase [Candidatus Vampirococcus lugosii]MBS8121943.1 pyruvate kinase [Candidatus Vampirococcus lugosii]